MKDETLKQLEKLLPILKGEEFYVQTEEFVKAFKATSEAIKKIREENITTSNTVIAQVEEIVNSLAKEHTNILENVKKSKDLSKNVSKEVKKELKDTLSKIKADFNLLRSEMALIENGKDADEDYIIKEVLAKIKLPEYKEVVLDGGEEIVAKINELPIDNPDFLIDAIHIKNLPKQGIISNSNKYLGQMLDVELSGVTYTNGKYILGSGGGGGGISGSGTINRHAIFTGATSIGNSDIEENTGTLIIRTKDLQVNSSTIQLGTTGVQIQRNGSNIQINGGGFLLQNSGGTGQTSYTAGDILYADSLGELQKLPIGTTGDVLTVTSGLPSWSASSGGSYTASNGLTLTGSDFTLGGTLTNSTAVDLDVYTLEFTSGGNPVLSLDATSLSSTGLTSAQIEAATTRISGASLLQIQTPNYSTASNGDVLTLIDNTTGEAEWQTPSGGGGGADYYSPTYAVWENDFISSSWTSTDSPFTQRNSGAGSGVGGPSTGRINNKYYGYITPSTGSTSTGFAGFSSTDNTAALEPASGNIDFTVVIKTPATLSTGTDRYLLKFGLSDSNVALGNNSINIAYTDTTNSGAWFLQMNTGAVTRATINSTVTVAANTWYKLRFTMTGVGQNLELFIDGVSAGTATPSSVFASGSAVGIINMISKSVGTAVVTYNHDYIRVIQTINR